MRCLALSVALTACSSEPIALLWKVDLGAPTVSTPLVTEQFIALGSQQGVSVIELSGARRCVFPASGEIISAPETDGKRIFFGSTNYIVYAIDLQCNLVWKFPTRDRVKSDPLYKDGVVYTSSYDGHVYALEADSGKELWEFPEPLVAELKEAATESPETTTRTIGVDASGTTTSVSMVEPAMKVGDFSYSSPIIEDGVLYLGNLDRHLYAITALDGTLQWRFRTDAAVTSSPLYLNGALYFGSNDGHVYAVDVKQMKVLWKHATGDWVNSSPNIVDGVLYIGGNDRFIYALDVATGNEKWKSPTKGPAIPIPAVYQNLVIGAGGSGDGTIYVLNKDNGSAFWQFNTGGKIDSDPVLVGDKLYVSSADGFLYAFQIRRTTAN